MEQFPTVRVTFLLETFTDLWRFHLWYLLGISKDQIESWLATKLEVKDEGPGLCRQIRSKYIWEIQFSGRWILAWSFFDFERVSFSQQVFVQRNSHSFTPLVF